VCDRCPVDALRVVSVGRYGFVRCGGFAANVGRVAKSHIVRPGAGRMTRLAPESSATDGRTVSEPSKGSLGGLGQASGRRSALRVVPAHCSRGKQSRHAGMSRPLGRMVDRAGEWQARAIREPGSDAVEVSGLEHSWNLRSAKSSLGYGLTGRDAFAKRRPGRSGAFQPAVGHAPGEGPEVVAHRRPLTPRTDRFEKRARARAGPDFAKT